MTDIKDEKLTPEVEEELKKLDKLLHDDIISIPEYERKKKKILEK